MNGEGKYEHGWGEEDVRPLPGGGFALSDAAVEEVMAASFGVARVAAPRPSEDQVAAVIRLAVFNADMWVLAHTPWPGTPATFTAGLVSQVVRYLGENGLIILPPDIDARLEDPHPMSAVPSNWPAS